MICSPLSPMAEPTSSHLAAELAFFSTANDLISRSTTISMGHSSTSSPWSEETIPSRNSKDLWITLFTPATSLSDVSRLRELLTACAGPLHFTRSSIRVYLASVSPAKVTGQGVVWTIWRKDGWSVSDSLWQFMDELEEYRLSAETC